MTEDGGRRPRLDAYGRRPERRLPKILRWTRQLVFALFAMVGAIALGRTWVEPLIGPRAPLGGAGSSTAATDGAQAVTPTPVEATSVTQAAPDDEPATPASGPPPLDFASNKSAAEEELQARMPEIDGLQYKDVRTNVSVTDGQPRVDFCGQVNSLNPMGVYIGFQRFISSRFDAKIEQGVAPGEFAQAWQQHCTGQEGPKVWN